MSGNFALNSPINGRKDVFARNRAGADQELAAHLAEKAVHRLAGFTRQREQPVSVGEQEPTRRRDRCPAAEPVQEPQAQFVLERADVLGDRGLGEGQRLGGARKGPQLGDLREDFELSQIHGGEYRRRGPSRAPRLI